MESEELIVNIEHRLTDRPEERCEYLSLFAYCLTETVRWLISEGPASEPLIFKMQAINEIQHRITSRLMRVLNCTDEWTERDFILTVMSFAQRGGCWPEVQQALEETVSKLRPKSDRLQSGPPLRTE